MVGGRESNRDTGEGGGGGCAHIRKPRKQRRVMGCELRRQLRSPCRGCWSMVEMVVGGLGGEAQDRATYADVKSG